VDARSISNDELSVATGAAAAAVMLFLFKRTGGLQWDFQCGF